MILKDRNYYYFYCSISKINRISNFITNQSAKTAPPPQTHHDIEFLGNFTYITRCSQNSQEFLNLFMSYQTFQYYKAKVRLVVIMI